MALQDTREGRDLARLFTATDETVARLRKAMEAEAAMPLAARLAAWIESDGTAKGEDAAYVAGTLLESPEMTRLAGSLSDPDACAVLRDAATGIAGLHALGDAGNAIEDYRHGHGRRP